MNFAAWFSILATAMLVAPPAAAATMSNSSPVLSDNIEPAAACAKLLATTPICGQSGPEDMELAPDGRRLIVSESGGLDGRPMSERKGMGIGLIDPANGTTVMLVPESSPLKGWGSKGCTAPDMLAPHGIHLSKRKDGRWQLLVVNHGGREAIEFYELKAVSDKYRLIWRGCVLAEEAALNDVVATRDGFIATAPIRRGLHDVTVILSGADTGYLAEWTAKKGLAKLPGSDAPFNNGIQLADNGRSVVYAAWTAKELRKYDRAQHRVVAVAKLGFHPDNISVSSGQKLIAAGIKDIGALGPCIAKQAIVCPVGFGVASIDPTDMSTRLVYEGAPGLLKGASVAIMRENALYVGSLSGDLILNIELKQRDEGITAIN